jgi:hypothetical protein
VHPSPTPCFFFLPGRSDSQHQILFGSLRLQSDSKSEGLAVEDEQRQQHLRSRCRRSGVNLQFASLGQCQRRRGIFWPKLLDSPSRHFAL